MKLSFFETNWAKIWFRIEFTCTSAPQLPHPTPIQKIVTTTNQPLSIWTCNHHQSTWITFGINGAAHSTLHHSTSYLPCIRCQFINYKHHRRMQCPTPECNGAAIADPIHGSNISHIFAFELHGTNITTILRVGVKSVPQHILRSCHCKHHNTTTECKTAAIADCIQSSNRSTFSH